MTDAAPLDVRRFETLQIITVFVGLIHQFVAFDYGTVDAVLAAALMLVLTLLVSRKRKNWVRWLFLVMYVLGAALMVWSAATFGMQGYPAVTLGITVVQTVALALLFTTESSDWLPSRPTSQ